VRPPTSAPYAGKTSAGWSDLAGSRTGSVGPDGLTVGEAVDTTLAESAVALLVEFPPDAGHLP